MLTLLVVPEINSPLKLSPKWRKLKGRVEV